MRSVVDLCNTALSHLAQGYVVNDLTENTPHASLCKTYYPICLGEMLDDTHPWSFAQTEQALNADTTDTSGIAYFLPSDLIRTFKLKSDERFYVQGDHLYTTAANPVLIYVFELQDLGRMPMKFKMALSYLLASRIAGALINDGNVQNRMLQMYELERTRAKNTDLQQHPIQRPEFEGSLFQAR